jgi:ribosomal protein L9
MELINNRHKIAEELTWNTINFKLKTWSWWKVYWWIWEKDIIREIKKRFKIELTKKHIDLPWWHIKKIWKSDVFIKLWKDAIAKILIIVESE